jgi:YHS domain-containing protein
MKLISTLVFITLFQLGLAQESDYYLKKGFVAEGYDVVAYFDGKAVEGKQDFIAKYDSVMFKFSSQENRATFKANPDKYIPQYGGYCAYAIATKEKKVSIDPETFEIREGKLYLFYNSWGTNTLELWLKEGSESLSKKADGNWEKIKRKN